MFLVGTKVIREPTQVQPSRSVLAWLTRQDFEGLGVPLLDPFAT